jgi:hypothetical protein
MYTIGSTLLLAALCALPEKPKIDLTNASIVARQTGAPEVEKTAVTVLVEEVEKRTGIHWKTQTSPAATGTVIVLTSKPEDLPKNLVVPDLTKITSQLKPEGFALFTKLQSDRNVVYVIGADARGVLFGVGKLLRLMELSSGVAKLDSATHVVSSPAYPMRGHQLGFRNRANSWDAWDVKQFDQYIRELAIFGSNCVENIPFQDETPGVLMRVPRKEMNIRMSEICQRYDQDYWIWMPADFDLQDSAKRLKSLEENEEFYKECPRLDGVFVPGGDPGDNDPSLVMPFLKDLSVLLSKYHPKARVWFSLQNFRGDRIEYVYRYLDQQKPDWLGGLVCGPSSPGITATRQRLDSRYPIRHYPDLTHNVRCQFPIPWWDPALAHTLGRESINPRPVQFAEIHNQLAPGTVGFLSYSDGVHDDLNKVVWNLRAWNPETPVPEIVTEYARFFFGANVAERAANGILALEKNWIGSVRDNGGIDATLTLWDDLEQQSPSLEKNWRWQMCLVRAVYDAYVRHRLIYESALEEAANAKLAEAPTIGSESAIAAATAILARAQTQPVRPDLRKRIDTLCEALFQSISLQTSMARYKASGAERGCILDFADHPLNSQWWLEDEFTAIRKLSSEPEKQARLQRLATWEHPGPGSFYDDVGNPSKSPHVVVGDLSSLGMRLARTPIPEVLWWENGKSRKRPAWMDVMNWPLAMVYTGLDKNATYIIRTTGYGVCLMSIDGERVLPTIDAKGVGEFKEFVVPKHLLSDGTLRLTFERPVETVNWRYHSRLSELWLLKK